MESTRGVSVYVEHPTRTATVDDCAARSRADDRYLSINDAKLSAGERVCAGGHVNLSAACCVGFHHSGAQCAMASAVITDPIDRGIRRIRRAVYGEGGSAMAVA